MANLKALETLALEGGRVSVGQVFELKSKEDAAILVAQGRAEETSADVDYEPTVVAKQKATTVHVSKEAVKEIVKTTAK